MKQFKDFRQSFCFTQYKIPIIIGAFVIFFLILGTISFHSNKGQELQEEIVPNKDEVKPQIVKNEVSKIGIDIKGAVKNPGVYTLDSGSRVSDAIIKSGGLRDDADTSMINLSKQLQDQMVIIIYTKKEIETLQKGNTSIKYIEKECICPDISNDACIDDNKITNQKPEDVKAPQETGKISLNHATAKELETLPGIGEKKALDIIQYREANGGFQSLEELKKVKGIGDATFAKLKEHITL